MKLSSLNRLLPVVATLSLTTFSAPAFAYLGSFERDQGYDTPYGKPWFDVTYYNAGEYGSNNLYPNPIGGLGWLISSRKRSSKI